MEAQKKFIDYSKTTEGKILLEQNSKLWVDGDFQKHIKNLNDPIEIELCQIIRKYQSSFTWIQKKLDGYRAFQIRHTPTCRPVDLESDFEILEGYLWFEIIIGKKYPEDPASFLVLNHSIPTNFKRTFERILFDKFIETKKVFSTLRYMDNNLDQIFKMATNGTYTSSPDMSHQEIYKQDHMEELEQKFNRFLLNNKPPMKMNDNTDNANGDKEADNSVTIEDKSLDWSQDNQELLEKALVTFRDVKDPKEKWAKIAETVPGKTMSDCVKRFKECKELAANKKKPETSKEKNLEKEENDDEETKEEPENNDQENQDDESEGSDDSDGSESDSADDGYSSVADEPEAKPTSSARPLPHISFEYNLIAKEMLLKNVSLALLASAQVQVACKSCGTIHQVEVGKCSNVDYLTNTERCPKCNCECALLCKPEFMHNNSSVSAKIGSWGWDIRDVHFCEYNLACEFCNTSNRSKKFMSGQQLNMDCFGCYKKMEFTYIALTLSFILADQATEDANLKYAQALSKEVVNLYKKKIGQFKVGEPLPKNGACKHYKSSKRFFRFACCGKAYPCDDCHNIVEKEHDLERAKNMICGYCSTEQSVANECRKCQKILTKSSIQTGHWEGGKGNRNKLTMSKKDPRKFMNSKFKTVSKKKKE